MKNTDTEIPVSKKVGTHHYLPWDCALRNFKKVLWKFKIRCFCYNLRLRLRISPRTPVPAAAIKPCFNQRVCSITCILLSRALHMPAACNHCGAPTPRRKATTSLLLPSMASLRAVLPSLQASGWLWFNENREQHWQRPHLSLAAK